MICADCAFAADNARVFAELAKVFTARQREMVDPMLDATNAGHVRCAEKENQRRLDHIWTDPAIYPARLASALLPSCSCQHRGATLPARDSVTGLFQARSWGRITERGPVIGTAACRLDSESLQVGFADVEAYWPPQDGR